MYTVEIFRITNYSKQVQVDVFTSDHYGLALSVLDHIWSKRNDMKHDHISIEIRMTYEGDGEIIHGRKWEYDVKGGTTVKEVTYDAD